MSFKGSLSELEQGVIVMMKLMLILTAGQRLANEGANNNQN